MKWVKCNGTYCLDTGRVVIGSAYIRPLPVESSAHALLVQRALLNKRRPSSVERTAKKIFDCLGGNWSCIDV